MKRLYITVAVLCAVIALVTFGHSAAGQTEWHEAHCQTAAQREEMLSNCVSITPVTAGVAALLWPFYWSWEAWS
jgi:hypothetical protein